MAITIALLRPDDLLHLTVEGHNLRLDKSDILAPRLVREDETADAFLVFSFPPQAFAEEAFVELDNAPVVVPSPPGEVRARISGGSRLAFQVPKDVASIPYSTAGLLDWSKLQPSLTAVAAIRGYPAFFIRSPVLVPPTATQTAIELPYRLTISPGPDARWQHRTGAERGAGRVVLWTTHLVDGSGASTQELGRGRTTQIRAIDSRDYNPASPPAAEGEDDPFRMSLSQYDRHSLVHLTSTFNRGPLLIGQGGKDRGKPAQTSRLMLSALGGFLEADGQWPEKPADLSFSSWKHLATLGRDHFVRVTYQGRLFPLMHRATLVKITERRFEKSPVDNSPVSYLRQYQRILVDEQEVVYDGSDFIHGGREMPLGRVRINVSVTPKLNTPGDTAKSPEKLATGSFEVWVGSKSWPFPCTSFDRAGNRIDFDADLIFVRDDDNPHGLPAIAAHYKANRRAAPTNGAPVKLADFESSAETALFVSAGFHFGFDLDVNGFDFLPKIDAFDVRAPSIEQLTGSITPTKLEFDPGYLANGLDAAAGLFARVAGDLDVGFSADQAGGIVKPDLSVKGFSTMFGPIAGDLGGVLGGNFDPASAFAGIDAKLFGAVPIKDLLASTLLSDAAPKIVSTLEPEGAPPERSVTKMLWDAPAKNVNLGVVEFKPDGPATRLKTEVAMTKPLDDPAAAPTTKVSGRLDNFSVTLLNVVRVRFESFSFVSATGQSTSVDVALNDAGPFEFLGALKFVQSLSEIIPPGIFGANGPRITLQPTSIEVGFALPLPPAAFGVFSIRNMAIGTSLILPFLTGRPSLSFAFSSREKPFQLSVLILGGGGFARVELDTEGIRSVEVMFEFGGMFSLDVGVASGSVHILAGIYIGLKGTDSELTGYVRVGGEVTILAIVSISIEFMLSLSYYPAQQVAKGVAKVTVSVRVAFISKSVSFSVERSFEAGSRHLSIAEAMSDSDWAAYAEAFA